MGDFTLIISHGAIIKRIEQLHADQVETVDMPKIRLQLAFIQKSDVGSGIFPTCMAAF